MMRVWLSVGGVAFGLLLLSPVAGPGALEAQGPEGRWPLQPGSTVDRIVAPFAEGWYENEDGTYSLSFGYLNLQLDVVEIPLGENNFIEPAEFDGMQPTTFHPGRNRGVFGITVPGALKDQDFWWTIRNPNGQVTRVPGRTIAAAYQLDWLPRANGSVPPLVSFDSDGDEGHEGRGPPGIVAERTLTASVGSPVTLSVNARDISERGDSDDFRFWEVIPVYVMWYRHQGPVGGEVEFTRHESTSARESDDLDRPVSIFSRRPGWAAGPNTIRLSEGEGVAQVYAMFSAPGEYLLRARADLFSAPDNAWRDQCCFTNGYVRVNVRP